MSDTSDITAIKKDIEALLNDIESMKVNNNLMERLFNKMESMEKEIQLLKSLQPQQKFKCNLCGANFDSESVLSNHIVTIHEPEEMVRTVSSRFWIPIQQRCQSTQ